MERKLHWLAESGVALVCALSMGCSSMPATQNLSLPDRVAGDVDVVVVSSQKGLDVSCYGEPYLGYNVSGGIAAGALMAGLGQWLFEWKDASNAKSVNQDGMSNYDFDAKAASEIVASLSQVPALKIEDASLIKDDSAESRQKALLASKEPLVLLVDVHYALKNYCRTANVTLSVDVFDTRPARATGATGIVVKPIYGRVFLSDIYLAKPHDLLSRTLS